MTNGLILNSVFAPMDNLFKLVDDLWWDRTTAFSKTWKNILPYNLYEDKKTGEVTLTMTAAGYPASELEVDFSSDGVLTVKSKKSTDEEQKEDVQYVHRGLATRAFQFVLALNPLLSVKEASMKNGLLKIVFTRNTKTSTRVEVKSS